MRSWLCLLSSQGKNDTTSTRGYHFDENNVAISTIFFVLITLSVSIKMIRKYSLSEKKTLQCFFSTEVDLVYGEMINQIWQSIKPSKSL